MGQYYNSAVVDTEGRVIPMKIRVVAKDGNKVVLDEYARGDANLNEMLALAEAVAVSIGYVMVEVDGEVYAEYES